MSQKRKSRLERRNKKQKTDVIDLDKYFYEVPVINLDQMDSADLDTPIVIDDEKENQSSQESDCCMEVCDELHDNSQNLVPEITNKTPSIVNHNMEIEKNTEVSSKNKQQIEVNNIDEEIKEYCEENFDRLVQNTESQNHSLDSPEKLLVPQIVLDLTDDNDSTKAKEEKEKRIKELEKDIAVCKELIAVLDEKEVTNDTCYSPYVQSEKLVVVNITLLL